MIRIPQDNDPTRSDDISVVIISYDREIIHLSNAIDSVLRQSSHPMEIIVVEGGSKEHFGIVSEQISCIKSPVPIRLIGKENMRAPEARNLGASECKGNYIAFLDDDDEWYPDKLKSQISMINSNAAIIYSPYDEEIDGITKQYSNPGRGYPDILSKNVIGCTSFPLIRKEVFDEVGGFDTSFQSNQEWDLYIRILKNHDALFCDVPAGIKHDTSGISSDVKKRIAGWKSMFKAHLPEYRGHPEQYRRAAYIFYREMHRRKCHTGIFIAMFRRAKAFLNI